MKRLIVQLGLACFAAGCLFGGSADSGDEPDGGGSSAPDLDEEQRDMAGSGAGDMRDTSTGQRDVMSSDASEEMGPTEDVGPMTFGPSSVCNGAQPASTDAEVRLRMRVHSNGTHLIGSMTAMNGANIVGQEWSTWDGADLVWTRPPPFNDLAGIAEIDMGTATGIAVQSFGGTPIWMLTRRDDVECVFVESIAGQTSIGCGTGSTTYGAAITNLAQSDPRYFWFEESGSISSMPYDDTAEGGGQIAVPWCLDPGSGCLSLDFGAVDARGNDGTHVLLSGPNGRAYAWDTAQQIADPGAAEDCGTPPEPPIPLTADGNPVRFDAIDMLWVDGGYTVVRTSPDGLHLHRLDANFELQPAHRLFERPGPKLLLGAATDGDRVAAVVRLGLEEFALVAFDGARPPLVSSIFVNGEPAPIAVGGVAIEGDDVGVMLDTDRGVYAGAVTMW